MDSLRIQRNLTSAPTPVNCTEITQPQAWLSQVVVYLQLIKRVLRELLLLLSEMLLELEPEMVSGHFICFVLTAFQAHLFHCEVCFKRDYSDLGFSCSVRCFQIIKIRPEVQSFSSWAR